MSNESEKPQWHEVVLHVTFLARKYKGENDYDFSKMSLQDIAYHILDGNGEFLGIWGMDEHRVIGMKEAERTAVHLGNDGGWVTDGYCTTCEKDEFDCLCE